MVRLGIDSGGTFTDFVVRHDDGSVDVFKLPSTPKNPGDALVAGVRSLAREIAGIVHGTTVATNAFLERDGSAPVFVTTEGFQDLLEIGRQNRPDLYALVPQRAPSLTSKTLGIEERLTGFGDVQTPLPSDWFDAISSKLSPEVPIAVCFLHADLNPAHEIEVARLLRDKGYHVSVSHEVANEFREYERASTTVVNAYVGPKIQRYFDDVTEQLDVPRFEIMNSNGYVSPIESVRQLPISTLLSGPAGGVIAARQIGAELGYQKLITLDMGGTSSDVSLIDGDISIRRQSEIGGFPIRAPFVDIETVGAGGGSIAYVDEGGALRVGPRSAGADPGPACYGGGGEEATVTDAHVALDRIESLLAGAAPLDKDAARETISRLGQTIGLGLEETALGILQVAEATMVRAIKTVSVARGHDPRDFTLVAFGGAGGLHACRLAEAFEIDTVIVPKHAGVLSALGMLSAERGSMTALSISKTLDEELVTFLEKTTQHSIDTVVAALHYRGQSHPLEVEIERWDAVEIAHCFHDAHAREFTYARLEQEIVLDCLYLSQVDATAIDYPSFRDVDREVAEGVVTDYGHTTIVEPGWIARMERGHLVMTR